MNPYERKRFLLLVPYSVKQASGNFRFIFVPAAISVMFGETHIQDIWWYFLKLYSNNIYNLSYWELLTEEKHRLKVVIIAQLRKSQWCLWISYKYWIIYSVTQCGVSVMSIQFLLKQAGGPAAGRGSLSVTQSCEILREYPHSAFSASPCSFPIHVCQSFRQDSLNRVRRLQIKSRVATRQILDRETRRIPQSQWEWRDACVQTAYRLDSGWSAAASAATTTFDSRESELWCDRKEGWWCEFIPFSLHPPFSTPGVICLTD